MKPEEMRWLWEDEGDFYDDLLGVVNDKYAPAQFPESYREAVTMVKILERLSRRAELLKKHEWKGHSVFGNCCLECGGLQPGFWGNRHNRELEGHKPNCAWAAELDGLPRGG